MNGVTLQNPFQTSQDPQDKRQYDFDQSLEALLAQNHSPDKIVKIMSSAGFDPYDVASSINKRYDDQRRQMFNDYKQLQDQLKAEKEAYDNILKKKDTALEQDGEKSVFGLDLSLSPDDQAKAYYDGLSNDQKWDQFGILSKSLALDKIKTDVLPTLTPPEPVNPPLTSELAVDNNLGTLNRIDDMALEVYSDYTAASKLKTAIANNDTKEIISLIDYFNAQKRLTEFPTEEALSVWDFMQKFSWSVVSPVTSYVVPERDKEPEPFSQDFLKNLDFEVDKILKESSNAQSNVMNMINDFNYRNNIPMQYNPSSEMDYNIFLRNSVNRSLTRAEEVEASLNEFIYSELTEDERKDPVKRKEAEDYYYGTIPDTFFGNLLAADRARGTWGEWWDTWQNNFGLALNPIVAETWGEDMGEVMENKLLEIKRQQDLREYDKKVQLARDFDITPEQLKMPIDQRFSETINGNISMGDFFATTTANAAEIMSDALISSAEFMIPYVGSTVMGLDIYSQTYADVVANQPHISPQEAMMTSAPKAVFEVLINKLMFAKGLGSVGALKDAAANLGAKETIKQVGKRAATERGLLSNAFTKYLLPEAMEEGIVSITNQTIDAVADVAQGRAVRDLNTYEVSDAFWAGMVGAVGPASIATFTSNLGHTRTMDDRLTTVKGINDLKSQIGSETNPDIKSNKVALLRDEIKKMKILATDEAAYYSALNPEEVRSIMSINQELSQTRDILKRGRYFTDEVVEESDIEGLENRMQDLYKEKANIENEAIRRAEAEMRAQERSNIVNNEDAAKRNETRTGTKADIEKAAEEASERERTIDDDIEDARRGDVEAQEKLKQYGIEWEYTPVYRFISESEVEALKKGETIKGKNPKFGADVTIDPEGEGAGATTTEYRVTFKEDGFDNKKTGSRVRMKNKQDGWVSEGYSMDDVAKIEKKNADGTWETVYEADAPTTDAIDKPQQKTSYDTILESEVSKSALKSILLSIRKSYPNSYAVDLLSDVIKEKPIDDFNYDYLNDENLTYQSVIDMLVSEEIFSTTREAVDKLSIIGKGIVMKDIAGKSVDKATAQEQTEVKPTETVEKDYDTVIKDYMNSVEDLELYYEELIVRGSPKMESRSQMSVVINGYEDFMDLWAAITGNGKLPSAMQNIYFIKDDKRYNVNPPSPKVDEDGNVIDMPLKKTLRDYLLQKAAEEELTTPKEDVSEEDVSEEDVELPKELTEEIDEGIFEKYTGENPFLKGLNLAERVRKKYFRSQKLLPKTVSRLLELEGGALAAHFKDVELSFKDFWKMHDAYKGDKEALLEDYDAALRGDVEALNRLPEEFAIHLKKVRNQIDRLSQEAIDVGVWDLSTEEGRKTARTVKDKLGKYLTRSFEIFDNDNWANEVSDKVVVAAKNLIRQQIKDAAKLEYESDPALQEKFETFEDYLTDRVDGLVNELLTKETAKGYIKGKALLGKGSDISKKLKDIPAEIRALMGEYADPMKNYAKSILKLASAVEGTKTMQKVREAGLGKWLFENPTGQFVSQIAAEGSETMRPLNGLYTTPEIAEAIKEVPQTKSALVELYIKHVSSRVKWAKTIGSVATHMKNILGNLGFMWANGHTQISQMSVAFETIKNDIQNRGDEALRERLKEYIQLGLVNQNVAIREINDMFSSENFENAMMDNLNSQRTSKKAKQAKGVVKGIKRQLLDTKSVILPAKFEQMLDDLYQAEDDFFKIVAFEIERNRYAEALFGKPYEKLTPKEKKALNEYIVDKIVKQTYPSYDRVPTAVRAPSQIWLGNFVSFVAESYRVSYNTLSLSAQEMASDNPKLKKIGMKRLAGALSYVSAKSGLVAGFGTLAGVGAMGIMGAFTDDEEEKRKRKATKNFVAPWSKDSDLLYYRVGDGKFSYIDLSASDPYGQISRVVNATVGSGEGVESMIDGLVVALSPFVDPDIGTRRLMNIIYNQDDYGKQIYNPEDPMVDQIADITAAFYEVIELGSVTSIRKIWNAEGFTDTSIELVGQISGLKPYTVDVAEAFGYKMARYKVRIANARKLKYEDVNEANKALQGIYQEIYEDAEAAQALGVTFKDLREVMMQWGGLGKQTSKDILLNRYRPLTIERRNE